MVTYCCQQRRPGRVPGWLAGFVYLRGRIIIASIPCTFVSGCEGHGVAVLCSVASRVARETNHLILFSYPVGCGAPLKKLPRVAVPKRFKYEYSLPRGSGFSAGNDTNNRARRSCTRYWTRGTSHRRVVLAELDCCSFVSDAPPSRTRARSACLWRHGGGGACGIWAGGTSTCGSPPRAGRNREISRSHQVI